MPPLLAARPDCWRCSEPSPEAAVQRGEVELSGDTEISQQFRELLKLLRPDPEEELSLLVGDVPAHQLGRLAAGALAFGRRLATTAVTNAAEYFAHERADLVPRAEGEQFLRGVDALRDERRSVAGPAGPLGAAAQRPVKLRVVVRLLEIQRVLLRHGLDDYVRATHLYRPLRFLFFLSPGIWFERRRRASRGERLRLALQELGPIFVKFGQAVSTRRDLLPTDIADELAKLQDRVPPFPGSVARQLVEVAYGKSVSEVFSQFEETPLAAASIAQVHVARLPNGQEVIVKVLRPDMRGVIERDLEVLHALADLAQRYWPEGRRLRPREIVDEYQKTILDELDLMREAANASQLKRNFAGSELLYVPEVHWDYCRAEVMVMERIHGVPISDWRACGPPAPTSRSWRRTAYASSSRRCSGTTSSMPTCTRGTSSCSSRTPRDRATRRWTSASSARSTRATSTILRRTSSRCSTATTAAWRSCTWSPAGCRPARAWTRWNPRCAPCASRSSTGRSRTSPSGAFCCGCSRSRGASTCRSSRS